MPIFPKIQSPCPYKSDLAAVMDGDFCRMCKRQVVDLDGMTDQGRVAYLAGCEEEVCVSYRLPFRPALAAAAIAAFAAPTAAAAQEAVPAEAVAAEQAVLDDAWAAGGELIMITVGGIKDPRNVEFASDPADLALPELPVTYEKDEDASPEPKTQSVSSPVGP